MVAEFVPAGQVVPKPSRTPRVTVVNVKCLDNGSNLKAYVSIKIGPMVINDCRVIQQTGQRAFVSMPQREYQDPNGQRKFAPIIEVPRDWKDAITDVVIPAWMEAQA